MRRAGDFRLMLMPDHYTLLSTRTHDGTPVPVAVYDSRAASQPRPFTEQACAGALVIGKKRRPDARALWRRVRARGGYM